MAAGQNSIINYRPDIDGLRAVAVISVLLYHAGFPLIKGGYIGVDIFFVISGYLITKILHKEVTSDSFSIAKFYERRALRIFPALFVVLASTTVAAYFIFLPSQLVGYSKSLIATISFVSNFFFLGQENYFVVPAASWPLLHTWSLAVEEQFYLFFPLMFYACHRWFASRVLNFTIVLALISFVSCLYLMEVDKSLAFYLPFSRAWELAVGAILALNAVPSARTVILRHVLAGAGAVCILISLFVYNKATSFPGVSALLPCLGGALIIYSGSHKDTFVYRFLSLKPIVWIGLVSYSLYLWHWPVIVFYRNLFEFDIAGKICVVILSILLAFVSWRFVEQPFRKNKFRSAEIFKSSLVAMSLFLSVGIVMLATHGVVERFSKHQQWLFSFIESDPSEYLRTGKCFLSSAYRETDLFSRSECLNHDTKKENFLLIGDSHAAHLWYGLSTINPEVNIQQATASGCRPILGGDGDADCIELITDVIRNYTKSSRPDAVILSARWNENDITKLKNTIEEVSKYTKQVYVIGPTVEYKNKLPKILAQVQGDNYASIVKKNTITSQRSLDRSMSEQLKGSSAIYISVYSLLCPDKNDVCTTAAPTSEDPIQFDYGHYTKNGSVYVASMIRAAGKIHIN